MKYLIDTHILIWLAISPQEISKDVLRTLENPENKVFVSTISLWEIAIKLSIGKLDLQGLKISDLVQFCDEQNIRIIQLPLSAVEQYQRLPKKENNKNNKHNNQLKTHKIVFLSMLHTKGINIFNFLASSVQV